VTLTKADRRIDSELLLHGESGVEVQFLHQQGVIAYARRFTLRAQAFVKTEAQRQRLVREGWSPDAIGKLG
jgi:hypothetical protein